MKTKFIVLSIEEQDVVKSTSLSSTGLETATEVFLMGTVEDVFDTQLGAFKRAEELTSSGCMVEIKTIFTK